MENWWLIIKRSQVFFSFRAHWAASALGWVPPNERNIIFRCERCYLKKAASIFACCESLFWEILPIQVNLLETEHHPEQLLEVNWCIMLPWCFPRVQKMAKAGKPSYAIVKHFDSIYILHILPNIFQYNDPDVTCDDIVWGNPRTEYNHPIDSSQACSKSWYFEDIYGFSCNFEMLTETANLKASSGVQLGLEKYYFFIQESLIVGPFSWKHQFHPSLPDQSWS